MQKLTSEQEMINFGYKLAQSLKTPAVIELIGDVGAGKTTITKGIARGLQVKEEITSPTFTLSKRYAFQKTTKIFFSYTMIFIAYKIQALCPKI